MQSKIRPLYIKAGLVPIRLTSDASTNGLGFTLQGRRIRRRIRPGPRHLGALYLRLAELPRRRREQGGGHGARRTRQGARRRQEVEGLDGIGDDRPPQRQPPAGDGDDRRHRSARTAPRRRGLGEGGRRSLLAFTGCSSLRVLRGALARFSLLLKRHRAGMPVAGPRGEDQQQASIGSCGDRVALAGVELQ